MDSLGSWLKESRACSRIDHVKWLCGTTFLIRKKFFSRTMKSYGEVHLEEWRYGNIVELG